MRLRGRVALVLAAVAVGAGRRRPTASAHAYSGQDRAVGQRRPDGPPSHVALTYDEAVEPRFAIISVTDAAGHQLTTDAADRARRPTRTRWSCRSARVSRRAGTSSTGARSPSTATPSSGALHLRRRPEPRAPRRSSSSRRSPRPRPRRRLVVARWVDVPDGDGGDRPVRPAHRDRQAARHGVSPARACGRSRSRSWSPRSARARRDPRLPRPRDRAVDSLRSAFASGRSCRCSASPRSAAAMSTSRSASRSSPLRRWIALWVDRPEREQRSIAELLATTGALARRRRRARRARAPRAMPAQTAPRGLSLLLDWLHLASGSLWIGGLVGLLVLWVTLAAGQPGRRARRLRPRFSNVAFVSVLVLLGSGVGATVLHMPILGRTVADLLRQGDPRQDRAARVRDAARRRQPADRQASPGRRRHSNGRRPVGRLVAARARSAARRRSWSARSSPRRSCPASPRLRARSRRRTPRSRGSGPAASPPPCTRTGTRSRCSSTRTRPSWQTRSR